LPSDNAILALVMTKPDDAQIERVWASVQAAMRKFNGGKPQDEPCVFCGEKIVVEGYTKEGPHSSWLIHCPCGMSNTTLKGL
jgi:hypothetical protein